MPIRKTRIKKMSNPHSKESITPLQRMSKVVRLAGLEPATYGLEGCCSIQLSYKRIEWY